MTDPPCKSPDRDPSADRQTVSPIEQPLSLYPVAALLSGASNELNQLFKLDLIEFYIFTPTIVATDIIGCGSIVVAYHLVPCRH